MRPQFLEIRELAVHIHELLLQLASHWERRYRTGDVAILEVNLSRTSSARARAERRVAAADLSTELGELRVLLGMKRESEEAMLFYSKDE